MQDAELRNEEPLGGEDIRESLWIAVEIRSELDAVFKKPAAGIRPPKNERPLRCAVARRVIGKQCGQQAGKPQHRLARTR